MLCRSRTVVADDDDAFMMDLFSRVDVDEILDVAGNRGKLRDDRFLDIFFTRTVCLFVCFKK